MNDWAPVFLGVIAVATLVMAAIQVGAIIYGARAAQRIEQMLGRFETDLKPVLERAKQVSEDAAKMSALATVQVERVDQVFQDLSQRIDETAADDPAGGGDAGARGRGAVRGGAGHGRRAARRAPAAAAGRRRRAWKKTTRSSSGEREQKENGGDARTTNGHWEPVLAAALARRSSPRRPRPRTPRRRSRRCRPRRWPSSWRRPSCSTSPPRIRPTPAASSRRCTCPGSQLMIVSARYGAPALLNEKVLLGKFQDAYIDLNSASEAATRVIVEDLRADGFALTKRKDMLRDSFEANGKRVVFDFDWRKQKLTEGRVLQHARSRRRAVRADARAAARRSVEAALTSPVPRRSAVTPGGGGATAGADRRVTHRPPVRTRTSVEAGVRQVALQLLRRRVPAHVGRTLRRIHAGSAP